jgi:uncharacterized protein YcfL
MIWRLCWLTLILMLLTGCDSDSRHPGEPSDGPVEYTIRDLQLTATLSDRTVARGDTVHIYLKVYNPNRKPIDVHFPGYCQEAFWVYDDQGRDVTPPEADSCSALLSGRSLHMDPLEERTYHLKWRTCNGIRPGRFDVLVGFSALLDDTPYTVRPISVEVLHREEDVTGTWKGSSWDFWGIPGWVDNGITLSLDQRRSRVTGTFNAGGPDFEIRSGSIADTELDFQLWLEGDDLEIEFVGDVCGDGIQGWRRLIRISTGRLLDTRYWRVARVKKGSP